MADNTELQHYGVLGMKWGIRKAQKNGTTYRYKSLSTKSYEKRADKAKEAGNTAKYKKNKQWAKKSAEFDKKMQRVADDMTAGQTFTQVLINGTFGAKTYAAARAYGYSDAGSTLMTTVMNILSGPVGEMMLTSELRREYVQGSRWS